MPYEYAGYRPYIFTEDGQVTFLKIRDTAERLLKEAGAVRCLELISGVTGDSWYMLACVDRLVELGEIREVEQVGRVMGQYRIFTRPY
jgi:hypothetical protein